MRFLDMPQEERNTGQSNRPDRQVGADEDLLLIDNIDDGFSSQSPLEELIYGFAGQSGVTPFESGFLLFRLGLLAPIQPGLIATSSGEQSGQIEVFNGTMSVGDVTILGDGKSIVFSGAGNDFVFAGSGDDLVFGGNGNDFLDGGCGGDILSGGAGIDTVSYLSSTAGVTIDLSSRKAQIGGDADGDVLQDIENVVGSAYDDTLIGTDERNIIHAGTGADTLFGGSGGSNDVLALGWDATASDPAQGVGLKRDTATDVVKAAATFAENGTDTIFEYFDVSGRADIIDLSDALEFSDALQTRAAQLSEAFEVHVNASDGRVEVRDAEENVWFTVYEDRDARNPYSAPEAIYVEVDGSQFEWDVFGGASSWDEI